MSDTPLVSASSSSQNVEIDQKGIVMNEVEKQLVERVKQQGCIDPDDAIKEMKQVPEPAVRKAIVHLVDKHQLMFNSACELTIVDR